MNIWDIINSINLSKKNLYESGDMTDKEYLPFIVNKSLSYFNDTLFHANEMNVHYHLPKQMQYEYLLTQIRPRKRFSKWLKKTEDKDVYYIMAYYNISNKRAIEYKSLLSKSQLQKIRDTMSVQD
jgi:hypothetical protein